MSRSRAAFRRRCARRPVPRGQAQGRGVGAGQDQGSDSGGRSRPPARAMANVGACRRPSRRCEVPAFVARRPSERRRARSAKIHLAARGRRIVEAPGRGKPDCREQRLDLGDTAGSIRSIQRRQHEVILERLDGVTKGLERIRLRRSTVSDQANGDLGQQFAIGRRSRTCCTWPSIACDRAARSIATSWS